MMGRMVMQVQKVFVNGVINRGLFPFGIIQEGYVKNKFIVKASKYY